jgi:hypothetical protein
MKTVLAAAAMALALVGFGSSASADIITWTFDDVTFEDGGTVSGFFDYDTVTSAAANFDIDTTAGTVLPAFHYTTSNSFFFAANLISPNSLTWLNNAQDRYINLAFDGSLSTPGVVDLRLGDLSGGADTNGSWECDNCFDIRDVASGSVTSPAGVPEPAAWALMLVGFGGLGAVLRRRKARLAVA